MRWSASRRRGWLPFLARVEWRAEGRGAERPGALLIGGRRVPVVVEGSWAEGGARGGDPVRHVFLVRDVEEGRFFRVVRSGDRSVVEVFVRADGESSRG